MGLPEERVFSVAAFNPGVIVTNLVYQYFRCVHQGTYFPLFPMSNTRTYISDHAKYFTFYLVPCIHSQTHWRSYAAESWGQPRNACISFRNWKTVGGPIQDPRETAEEV